MAGLKVPAQPAVPALAVPNPSALALHYQVLRNAGCELLRQIKLTAPRLRNRHSVEALHRLRVTVRRLRVLVRLLERAHDGWDLRLQRRVARTLKWLARALGPARDSDVFLREIWPPARKALGDTTLAKAMDAMWRARQRRQRRKVQSVLGLPRFQRLLDTLDAWFASSGADTRELVQVPGARQFACKTIRRRVRRVRRRHAQARAGALTDDRTLHRFRIEIKKLRYELDFLAPLLSRRRAIRAVHRLGRVQDTLGAMHDLIVAERTVVGALRRQTGDAPQRITRRLASRRKAQMKALRPALRSAWKDYRAAPPVH